MVRGVGRFEILNMMDTTSVRTKSSSWTIRLGSLHKTGINLHLSVLFLIGWWFLLSTGEKSPAMISYVRQLAVGTGIVLSLIFHELAHVAAAYLMRISVQEVHLYPFGGIRLAKGESRPTAEAVVALAGPFMTGVIACVSLGLSPEYAEILSQSMQGAAIDSALVYGGSVQFQLAAFNMLLLMVNIIPAPPLDGAKFLAALLAGAGVRRAQQAVAKIGVVLSLIILIVGMLMANPLLIIAGVLLASHGIPAIFRENARELLGNLTVREVLTDRESLICLPHNLTVYAAIKRVVHSYSPAFPVFSGQRLIGVLERESVLRRVASIPGDVYVGEVADRDLVVVAPSEPASAALEIFENQQPSMIAVREGDQFIGALFEDRLYELAMVTGALQSAKAREDDDADFFM